MACFFVCALRQPVPTLEATMARYLERSLPLLTSPEAQEATKAKVLGINHVIHAPFWACMQDDDR